MPTPEKKKASAPVVFCLCCTRFACRLLLLLALLTVGALAWLQHFGFPRLAVDALIRQAARQGILLEIESMHLRIPEGITARKLVWYSPRDPLYAMVQADSAQIGFHWTSLLAGKLDSKILDVIAFSGCTLRQPYGSGTARREMRVDDLHARLRFVPEGYLLESFGAHILNFQTGMRGRVLDPGGGSTGKLDIAQAVESVQKSILEMQPVHRLLDQITYTSPPELFVDFDVDTRNITNATLRVSLRTDAPFTVHGQKFQRASFSGQLRDGQLLIHAARIESTHGRFEVSGNYDLHANRVTADIHTSLHPDQLLALSPQALRDELAGLRLSFSGKLDADIHLRNTLATEAHRHFSAHIHLQDTRYRGVLAQDITFDLTRDGDLLRLNNIQGRMGEGRESGPCSGNLEANIHTHTFRLEFESRMDPWVILPLVGPGTESILKGLDFTDPPPLFQGIFSGYQAEDGTMDLFFKGQAESGAVIVRGTAFDQAKASLDIGPYHAYVDNIDGLQGDRYIRGYYHHDSHTGLASVDLESTLDPVDIGRIISPEVEQFMASYPVRGASFLSAQGDIDQRHLRDNRVVGAFRGDNVEVLGVTADHIEGWWTLAGENATLSGLEASIYGGKGYGLFQAWPIHSDGNRFFYATGQFENVNLALHHRSQGQSLTGLLSGEIILHGPLADDRLEGMVGNGKIALREGALFQIKLFGGLSRYLSKLVPGFGYSSQTDLTATLEIRNRTIYSNDAKIFGNVISTFMRGKITFDYILDFDVQVKLLNEGFFSKALQLISWPITKLFEFRLSGSLEDPKWRPNNLPKEIFLQF